MAPHFTETAPGVHTTTLSDPKTERRHNIAIIESCDAWQLFIDGELKTRDLPSFKAAVAAAQSSIATRRSPSMVRVACALVLLSVAGASTVGMAKVIAPLLDSENAITEVASNTKSSEIPPRFTRVRPPAKIQKAEKATPKTKSQPPVEKVFVTVTAPPTSIGLSPETPEPRKLETAPTEIVAPAEKESSSSDVAPFGLRPITPSTIAAAPPVAPPNQDVTKAVSPPPLTTEPEPEAARSEEPAADEDASTKVDSAPISSTASPDAAPAPLPTANEVVSVSPPLPVRAPALAVPVIRTARAPIETARLNTILADIEDESNETETNASSYQPTSAPRATKRKAPKRHKVTKRSRRVKRSAPNRRARQVRRRPIHTARAHRLPPARRMVCFAHSCRFR